MEHPSYCKCNKCSRKSHDKSDNRGENVTVLCNRDLHIRQKIGGCNISKFYLPTNVKDIKELRNPKTNRVIKSFTELDIFDDVVSLSVYSDVEEVAVLVWFKSE